REVEVAAAVSCGKGSDRVDRGGCSAVRGGVMDDPAMLDLATDLAERAGAEIRAIRARGFAVQRKADRSVVTEADHAAEALILAGLRAALPGCVVVAEEEIAA